MKALTFALGLSAVVFIFYFGYLVGAGHAIDRMQQNAVDEGYAVRDPEWRWRSTDELRRR